MSKPKDITPFGFKRRSGLKSNNLWKYGQKSTIAQIVGMSRQQLNSILKGKSKAKPLDAVRLSEAAKMVGHNIPALDFIFSKETTNPLFDNGQSFFSAEDTIAEAKEEIKAKAKELYNQYLKKHGAVDGSEEIT